MTEAPPKKRVLVLCLTYGEPHSNDWRSQFEYSLSILNRLTRRVAPIPKFVTPLLAARRGLARKKMFNEMGFNSPLEQITEAQVAKIADALKRRRPDVDFDVRMQMEFRPPYLQETLEQIRQNPPDEIVMLPLYVAESDFTTGISRTDMARFDARHRGAHGLPQPAFVGGFGFDERMGRAFAQFVENTCEQQGWTAEKCRDATLILGAHGTLQFPPEGINSGARETLYFFGLIRQHLKHRFRTVRVAWLNHTLGGKWTFPSAEEAAQEVWDNGARKVVYFPFGFMGDNNESMNEGRLALAEHEWEEMLYLPCPNDDEAFCDLLAEMTLERLDDPMREQWNRLEQGGRRDLIQKERSAIPGTPGLLKFNGPTLGALAILLWALMGSLLVWRGVAVGAQIATPLGLALAAFFALLIGYYKGSRILGRVIVKNLKRHARIPQPSPLYMVYSKPTWFVIIFFSVLGRSLRYLHLPPAVYTAILCGVGLALFYAVAVGMLNYRESIPRRIISMKDAEPQKAPA